METLSFKELIFRTAFCCMACDGDIDPREIVTIKSICEKLPLFENFNIQTEANILINKLNEQGKEFILSFFKLLEKTSLTEEEELNLIDIAQKVCWADEILNYSEIKFFKNIRHRLKVKDEKILERFSEVEDIERFLEKEIETESLLDKITNQYLDIAKLSKFEVIQVDKNLL